MRSFINSTSLVSAIVRNADNETGSALPLPSDSPAIGARIIEAKQPVPSSEAIAAIVKADGEKRAAAKAKQQAAREAAKPVNSGARKIRTTKADKQAAAANKPAKPAEPAKPETHGMRGTYAGASPTFRMHGRKLSPIVLDRIPGSFTERDAAFLSDLYKQHGTKAFKRLDSDAGNVSRAIGHAYIKHVSGALDSRVAEFALTERYVRERQQSAKAKPASKR